MIRVEQTLTVPPLGNCFAACIASVLECPLSAVPHPTAEEGSDFDAWQLYLERVQHFLARRNLCLMPLSLRDANGQVLKPAGYALLGVTSPRTGGIHSVVALDGEIVWDPHPGRGLGVGDWQDWHVFGVIDPSRPVNVPQPDFYRIPHCSDPW